MNKMGAAVFASLFLVLVLGFSFLKLFQYKPVKIQEFPAVAPKPFEGSVDITITKYDTATRQLTATLLLSVEAIDGTHEIEDIAFSPAQDWLADERRWRYFDRGATNVVHLEKRRGDNKATVDAVEATEVLTLPLVTVREAILYPFDRYEMDLSFAACVNSGGNACIGKDNLYIRKISIDYNALGLDPGFAVESVDSSLAFYIQRNSFIRLSSILLFGISLAFFFFLVFVYDGDDLLKGSLGYFGALWALRGLIVPKAIVIFPTLVDYIVLIIFVVLFVLVFFKSAFGRSEKTDHKEEKR